MSVLADRMVEFAHSAQFSDMGDAVVHQAKRRFLDTIGCALGAYTSPTARIARNLALRVSGTNGARVFGSLIRTTPDLAAFANGVMIRYLDFNDCDMGHPSDNLGGVIVAAELAHASGRDTITALAIAYELQNRLMISIPFYEHGWDHSVALVMGCSLACGRLLGLTREQLHHALAIAIIPNLSTFQCRGGSELSMWKGCQAPNAARQGLFAAQLAGAGMTGPTDPIDGIYGLWAQTVGKPYEVVPFKLGPGCAITITDIKRYPVRETCQLVADTALKLRNQVPATDIASLHIETYRTAYKKCVEEPEMWQPRTRETADHSMLAATAFALLDGGITPDTFNRRRFLDTDVLDLIKRTRVDVIEEFDRDFREHAIRHCRMEATTRSGTKCIAHVQHTKEDIARGPSDRELEGKFESLTSGVLPPEERRGLMDLLWKLDSVPDINQLIDKLRV